MATIRRRTTIGGELRYDVRYWMAGQDRQQSKSFRRYEDAEIFKRKMESDEVSGLVTDHHRGTEAVAPYAEHWMVTRLTRGLPLRASTLHGYQGLWRRNIAPALGALPLRRLSPELIREWHAALVASAGPDQAAKSYRLLRAILNTAVDEELLPRNPCRIKGAGIERAEERPMPTTSVVLDLADAMEPRYRALVVLAALGGLRTGEMLGLRRSDIDPLRGTVSVARQVQEIAGQRVLVEAAKTDAGRRVVALPASVMSALVEHESRYSQPGQFGAVFTNPEGGLVRRASLCVAFQEACAKVGAPPGLHIHDLRHHAATVMARMPGITTKELMSRIGHKSPRAALIYQHATQERDKAIADFLDAQLAGVDRRQDAAVIDISGRKSAN